MSTTACVDMTEVARVLAIYIVFMTGLLLIPDSWKWSLFLFAAACLLCGLLRSSSGVLLTGLHVRLLKICIFWTRGEYFSEINEERPGKETGAPPPLDVSRQPSWKLCNYFSRHRTPQPSHLGQRSRPTVCRYCA